MADVGLFKAGSQDHVEQDAWHQIGKVSRRQSDEAKQAAKWCEWNQGEKCDAGKGEQGERRRRAALNERQFWCANHVDHEGLAPHRFNKPSRLEHAHIGSLHMQQLCAAEMAGQVVIENAL